MSKFLRMALLVALGVLSIASAAFAVVPDPTFSSCDACLVPAPAGDYAFTVNVKDQFNNAINNSNVTIDFGLCGGSVVFCSNQEAGFTTSGATISGHTAADGHVTFRIHGGGACVANVRIYADGVQICSVGRAHSPDLNADKFVDVSDVALLAAAQVAQDLSADLNCDGFVDVSDVALFAASQLAASSDPHCP